MKLTVVIQSTFTSWKRWLELLHVNMAFVTFSSPNWRNQWRTTYPRSPLSHKCHRSQLKLNPLPSRTASLLRHNNKVSAVLWHLLMVKVMCLKMTLLHFWFFCRKTRREPSPETGKEEESQKRDMRPLCMQKTSSPVYATPFFFFPLFARRTLTKTFFVIGTKHLIASWKIKRLLYTWSICWWIFGYWLWIPCNHL